MIDGALLLDKPVGLSSNSALQQAKRLFRAAKAGHGGTLDPLASGLMVILFGEATKFAGPMLDADKEYVATLKLGETTSTGDAEGTVLERKPVRVSRELVTTTLSRFLGEIEQIPPMHSALKRAGVPLYKLARKGESVERSPRRVEIHELECLELGIDALRMRVRCSKGTYIRTLAEDIGAALGCGAHLSALRRTASGRFRIDAAATLQALDALAPAVREKHLLPLSALLADLPRAEVDEAAEARLRHGQALKISGLSEGLCGVYGPGGALIGLGVAQADGLLRPLRLTQSQKAR
ncbi:MAG: tRNA pseudouridine(55) synthase TruB [Betaproteobacteria bacterium]